MTLQRGPSCQCGPPHRTLPATPPARLWPRANTCVCPYTGQPAPAHRRPWLPIERGTSRSVWVQCSATAVEPAGADNAAQTEAQTPVRRRPRKGAPESEQRDLSAIGKHSYRIILAYDGSEYNVSLQRGIGLSLAPRGHLPSSAHECRRRAKAHKRALRLCRPWPGAPGTRHAHTAPLTHYACASYICVRWSHSCSLAMCRVGSYSLAHPPCSNGSSTRSARYCGSPAPSSVCAQRDAQTRVCTRADSVCSSGRE